MSDPDQPSEKSDWKAQRRAERGDRMRNGFPGAPVGGLILLVIGAVLLAQNLGFNLPPHWWAAFLLIPAGGALVSAIRAYRRDNRLSSRVVGGLVAGAVFLVLACSIYFGVGWRVFWPVILIAIGAGLLARNYWRRGK